MNSTPSEGAAAAQKAKLEAAFLLLGDVRITNYIAAAVASLTLYACDYISTLEKEIELVWKRRPSMSDLIYIWIRYFTFATLAVNVIFNLSTARSNEVCRNYILFGQVTTSAIIVGCADLILATRVWILYRRARLLLWILLPLVLLEIASMMVDGFVAILPLKEFLHLGPQLGGCYPAEPVRLLTYFTVGPLIVQFIMFTLTAYKCTKTMAVMGPGRTPLITMFLRDGVFWFMTALAICVVDFVIWSSARPTLAQVAVVPTTGAVGIIGARVLMNIKKVIGPRSAPATTWTSATAISSGGQIRSGDRLPVPQKQGGATKIYFTRTVTAV